MKVRIMFVDLATYPDREAEALDLGNVRVVEVLDNWNTPRGQAVKMLVEVLDEVFVPIDRALADAYRMDPATRAAADSYLHGLKGGFGD